MPYSPCRGRCTGGHASCRAKSRQPSRRPKRPARSRRCRSCSSRTISPPPLACVADRLDAVLGKQFGDRDAGDRGIARQRHHRVAMAAEDECGHVLDRDLQFHRDEGAEAGRVEHAGHADDPLARKPGRSNATWHIASSGLETTIDDRIRRARHDLARSPMHDVHVDLQQIVAAHARLACDPDVMTTTSESAVAS